MPQMISLSVEQVSALQAALTEKDALQHRLRMVEDRASAQESAAAEAMRDAAAQTEVARKAALEAREREAASAVALKQHEELLDGMDALRQEVEEERSQQQAAADLEVEEVQTQRAEGHRWPAFAQHQKKHPRIAQDSRESSATRRGRGCGIRC